MLSFLSYVALEEQRWRSRAWQVSQTLTGLGEAGSGSSVSIKAQIWGFSVTQVNENDSHLAAYYVIDCLASIHILSMILDSDPIPQMLYLD